MYEIQRYVSSDWAQRGINNMVKKWYSFVQMASDKSWLVCLFVKPEEEVLENDNEEWTKEVTYELTTETSKSISDESEETESLS